MSKYFDKQSEQAIKLLAAANARKNTMESLQFSGLAGRDAFTFFDIDLSGYLLKYEAEDTYVALADFDQLVIEALKQDIVSTDNTVSISYTEEGYVDLSVSSTLEDYLTIINAQKTYVASETIRTIVKLTLDEYDALTSKDSSTMYVITDEQSTTYLTREDADKLYQPIGNYATKSDLNSYVLTTYLTSNYYDKSYIDSLIKNIEGSVSSESDSSLKKSDFLTSGYWVVNYSEWSVDYNSNVAVGFKKDGTTETYLFTIPGATSQTAGVMTTELYNNLNTLWQAYKEGDLTKGGGEGDGLTTGDVNNLINAALSGYATQSWVTEQISEITGGSITSVTVQEMIDTSLSNYVKKTEFATINGQSIINGGDIQISGSGTVDLSNYVKFTDLAKSSTTGVIKVTNPSIIPSGSIQEIDPTSDSYRNRIYGLSTYPDGTAYVVVPWESGSGSGTVDLSDYVLKSDLTDSDNWLLQQGEGEENVDGKQTGIYVKYDDKNLFFIPFASEYSYGFITSEDKVYLDMLKKYIAETNPNSTYLVPVSTLAKFFGELYNDNAGLSNGNKSSSTATFYFYDFDTDDTFFNDCSFRISLANSSYAGVMSATDKTRLDDLWTAYQSGALGGGGDINLSDYASKELLVDWLHALANNGYYISWHHVAGDRSLNFHTAYITSTDGGITGVVRNQLEFPVVESDDIISIKVLTSAEYSALGTKDSNTMYCITD